MNDMEAAQVKATSTEPLGLYIHVPFCASTCDFCAFYQVKPTTDDVDKFLEGVRTEAAMIDWPRKLSTVFWGGGTPGLLSPNAIRKLGDLVHQQGLDPNYEWSVEMAPASVTDARLAALKDIGVTRISMGVQSFQPALLDALGRQHTLEQVYRAYDRVQAAEFKSVNLDLMFALPGQTAAEWSADVAEAVGAPPPNSVSQRDVPGWTRAAIPLLNKHGVIGLSFGAGTPPGKPDIPPMFVWRHEQSGTEVVTTWETAYGSINTLFVLPNGVALAVQWEGDNTGPGPIEQVQSFYTTLRTKYPHATVNVSTFDAFFAVANQPEVKSQLPVVTKEIGDGWIYGVPSDPLKNAMFREVARQRSACIASGECDLGSPDMKAFDRLLVKIPEHTW